MFSVWVIRLGRLSKPSRFYFALFFVAMRSGRCGICKSGVRCARFVKLRGKPLRMFTWRAVHRSRSRGKVVHKKNPSHAYHARPPWERNAAQDSFSCNARLRRRSSGGHLASRFSLGWSGKRLGSPQWNKKPKVARLFNLVSCGHFNGGKPGRRALPVFLERPVGATA